jgi:hypothetical protein
VSVKVHAHITQCYKFITDNSLLSVISGIISGFLAAKPLKCVGYFCRLFV